jgi:hypothetical protein
VLGHAGIAIAPDGVDLDAPARRRSKIDEARGAGAEKNDVPKVPAAGKQVSIEEGMVVDADVEAVEEAWQPIGLAVGDVDPDGWVFRPQHALPQLDHAGEAVQKEYRHRDRRCLSGQSIRRPQRCTTEAICDPPRDHVSRSVAISRAAIGQNAVATHPFSPVPGQVRIGRTIMGPERLGGIPCVLIGSSRRCNGGGKRRCR